MYVPPENEPYPGTLQPPAPASAAAPSYHPQQAPPAYPQQPRRPAQPAHPKQRIQSIMARRVILQEVSTCFPLGATAACPACTW